MFWEFSKYFLHYIFAAKTRQRLLFIAFAGLFLSALALIILQSAMGGLQGKLIARAKSVQGHGTIYFNDKSEKFVKEVFKELQEFGVVEANMEYELELLLRHGTLLSPVVVHAIDLGHKMPAFLQGGVEEGVVIPFDLSLRMNIDIGDVIKLISPAHVDSFMGDIPRSTTVEAGRVISTNVPEIDSYHLWLRLPLIQNLIRKRDINRIRIFQPFNIKDLVSFLDSRYQGKLRLRSWEEENKNLVWSLNLETTVMFFLFASMTVLVSLSITSGLMIFFDKIKGDLASFWIMGASRKGLERSSIFFLNLLSFSAIALGLAVGITILLFLDHYAPEMMPDVFVDRKIPIDITFKGVMVSLLVPYAISIIFSLFALSQFKKDTTFLNHVRSIG